MQLVENKLNEYRKIQKLSNKKITAYDVAHKAAEFTEQTLAIFDQNDTTLWITWKISRNKFIITEDIVNLQGLGYHYLLKQLITVKLLLNNSNEINSI